MLSGSRSSLIPIVISFLSKREHRVLYQGALSEYANTTCGVPQGTKLGPVIFLALVNPLCREMALRGKFVDDLTLAFLLRIRQLLANPMQHNLDTLDNEAEDINMDTNPTKCNALYLFPAQRKVPLVYPDLHLKGTPLPVVSSCKLLGVHVDSDLSWNTHVNKTIAKANKCIFILHRAKKFNFTIQSLLTLYMWFVRTGLEYAAPVWHPALTLVQRTHIERVQRRCFRIILGREYTTYEDALARLNCSSLEDRREMLTLRFGKSLLRSQFHRDLLPPTVGRIHGRNTRHHQRLQPVRCTKEFYKKSTIPYVVSLLNQTL